MSTWHQQQAAERNPTPLWHTTRWTVVNDRIGALMTFATFDNEAIANSHAAQTGGYVLPPAPGGRK